MTKPQPSGGRERYRLPDTVRGIVMISMIAYHGFWDLIHVAGADWPWAGSPWVYVWQQSIGWTFILLSGFCWPMGRRHLRRGAEVFGAGFLVTAVTLAAVPENRIVFGVLTLLGSCMLLLIPAEKALRHVPAWLGLPVFFLIFCFFRNLGEGTLGFGELALIRVPEGCYRGLLTAYLGMPPAEFFSTDYYPLLPWLFLFVCGYFLHRLLIPTALWNRIKGIGLRPLGFLGRHSLLIYLVHQPVLYGLTLVIRNLM